MDTDDVLAGLAALAQANRLAIFRLLVEHAPDGLSAGVIAARLGLAPATLSFHLKELGNADLVTTRHEGRFIYCSAHFATMNGLLAYLTDNCCGSGTAFVPFCAPTPRHAQREEPS